jgi:hypothetical protein
MVFDLDFVGVESHSLDIRVVKIAAKPSKRISLSSTSRCFHGKGEKRLTREEQRCSENLLGWNDPLHASFHSGIYEHSLARHCHRCYRRDQSILSFECFCK